MKDLGHGFADRLLFDNVNLRISKSDKIGLVGVNGAGKSTLINILTGNLLQDKGDVNKRASCKVGYIDQYVTTDKNFTIRDYLRLSFANLTKKEEEYNKINEEFASCDPADIDRLLKKSSNILEFLVANDYFNMDNIIEKFASGLGLVQLGLDTKMSNLSGGQLSKCMLCKILLEKPDILILDEPTNHLDIEHIDWLANFLLNYENGVLVVSHNTEFLNKICNTIWSVEFKTIRSYTGNYNKFLSLHKEIVERQEKLRETQEKKIEKLEDFIARKSAKTCTARMAQSKKKQLEKIEIVEKLEEPPTPNFEFKYKPIKVTDMIVAENLRIGYDRPLVRNISLQLKLGEKVCITGFNGLGKTTLIKTLIGKIPPLAFKTLKIEEKWSLGYFEQNMDWADESITALQEMKNTFPELEDRVLRGYLAKAGLVGKYLTYPLTKLSGGEQSKIKLCKIMIKSYNILIFDEPTNHLDVKAKKALIDAVNKFQGSVIFVSHEKSFADRIDCKVINLKDYV